MGTTHGAEELGLCPHGLACQAGAWGRYQYVYHIVVIIVSLLERSSWVRPAFAYCFGSPAAAARTRPRYLAAAAYPDR